MSVSVARLDAAGPARAVLERLLRWGRAAGATQAYLQVHSRNVSP